MKNSFSMALLHNAITANDKFIQHHGIKNMHWGERNGPPYPLDRHVSASIKAGHYTGSKSSKDDSDDPHGKKTTIGEKIKARVAPLAISTVWGGMGTGMGLISGMSLASSALFAAPVAGLGVLTLGGQELANVLAKHKEKKVKDIISKSETDKKTGLKLKPEQTTIKEDIKMVNPGYADLYKNTKHNCALCSATYDMRRRGFNVTSQKAKIGYSDTDIEGFYKNAKFEHINYEKGLGSMGRNNEKILDSMRKQGVGARGIITVAWKGGGGHALNYEVTDEGPRLIDSQSGTIYKNANTILAHSYGYMSILRTDTLKPDYEMMKKEVVV